MVGTPSYSPMLIYPMSVLQLAGEISFKPNTGKHPVSVRDPYLFEAVLAGDNMSSWKFYI